MEPKVSFIDSFTNEGRLKKLWVAALAEPDPATSLELLRDVRLRMHESPAEFAHLWLPFLDTFFAPERVRRLLGTDMRAVEDMGRLLPQVKTSANAPAPAEIWLRLVRAYDAREETSQALALLGRTYRHATATEKVKAQCIHELARRGAMDDDILHLYLEHLRGSREPYSETALLATLGRFFEVDFSTDPARLKQAYFVGQALFSAGILLPRQRTALGLGALLLDQAPSEALNAFTSAYEADQNDQVALCGVLTCWMRLGNYIEVLTRLQDERHAQHLKNPIIAGLLEICNAIIWLEHPQTPDLPLRDPGRLQQLKGLELHRYAGNVVLSTLGRLFLLSGDAQEALSAFTSLKPLTREHPQWAYYASWAYTLTGNTSEIAQFFLTLAGWPGQWAIASLLLDRDPQLAEECGAVALLRNIVDMNGPLAPLLKQKLARAHGLAAPGTVEKPTSSSFLEGELEILRIQLANTEKPAEMERLIRQPLFLRLPLADQLFWEGLLAWQQGDLRQTGALMERASRSLGNRRAALFLGIHLLGQEQIDQARPYLDWALPGQHDLRFNLISIYLEGREGLLDSAIEQCEQLLPQAEGHYLLGFLFLYKARQQPEQAQQHYEQAAQTWRTALAVEGQTLPGNLKALELCASFLAYPQQRASTATALWKAWQELESAQRQPWIEWHATLAVLWYGTPAEVASAYTECEHLLEMLKSLPPSATLALVRALTLAAGRTEHESQANRLIILLERLKRLNIHPTITRLGQSGTIAALLGLYRRTAPGQRARMQQNLHLFAQKDPGNELLPLLLAYTYLVENRRAEAMTLLQSATPTGKRLAYIYKCLIELLRGRIPPPQSAALLNTGEHTTLTLLEYVLTIAASFATHEVEQGYEALARQKTGQVLLAWRLDRLLPAFCIYLLQNKRPLPAFLKDIPLDSEQTDSETARPARVGNDLSRNLRYDLVKLLCHQAVIAQQTGASFEAARQLRLAAHWSTDDMDVAMSRPVLVDQSRALALRAATSRLLTYLFPELNDPHTLIGRYHCLAQVIMQSPALITALGDEDRERVQLEWNKLLQNSAANVRFLHALSVIYREIALSREREQRAEERDWLVSTALWVLLLSSDAFWHYFSQERGSNGQRKQPVLHQQQQQALWHDALESILAYHQKNAREAFAAGDYADAQRHLLCLDLCRQGEQALLTTLSAHGLCYSPELISPRIVEIRQYAQRLLDEWGQELIAEAEDLLSAPDLPTGAQKDYQSALEMLKPLVALDIPLFNILLTCLTWYNNWWHDCYQNVPQKELQMISHAAQEVAERLAPLCKKQNTLSAENKALALYFTYRGYSYEHSQESLQAYAEAISWTPHASNAEELLERERLELLRQQILDSAARGQFDEAYALLEQESTLIQSQDELQAMRAQIYLQQGRKLASEGNYVEAREIARQGYQLDPLSDSLLEFVQEMEGMQSEEENGRLLKEAQERLEERDFERTLRLLGRIPRSSFFFKQACSLQVATCLQSAVDYTDKDQLDKAEEQLRRASSLDETNEKRSLIEQQLSTVLTRRATAEIKRMHRMNINTQRELIKSRQIYARSLLEEALDFHPANEDAQIQLEELNKLMNA